MIRLYRAFLWLRWRLFVNGLKGSRQRDSAERTARISAVLVQVIFGFFFLLGAALLGWLAFLAGGLLGTGEIQAEPIFFGVRAIVFVAFATMVLLIPLGLSEQGSVAGSANFILLPVRRRALHGLEVTTALANPWVMFLVPGAMLLPAGLLLSGRPFTALHAFAAGLVLLGLAASFATLLSFLTQWLLRDRGRGEIFVLLLFAIIVLASFLVPLAGDEELRALEEGPAPSAQQTGSEWAFIPNLPGWTVGIPSELYASSVHSAVEQGAGAGLARLAGLLLEAALLFALSSAIHGRLLGSPESGRARGRSARRGESTLHLPGLSPGVSAIAQAQVRAVLRTVRGKMGVCVGGILTLVFGIVGQRVPEMVPAGTFILADGSVLAAAGFLMALISLHPILLNQFAADRAGLALQFLVPISDRDLVRGKAVGGALLLGIAALPCIVAAFLLGAGASVWQWISVLLGMVSVYALMVPVGALLSTWFPKPADLSKIGTAGNAHGTAGLIGLVLTLFALVPPGLIIQVAGRQTGRPILTLALVALWTILTAAFSFTLLGPIAAAVRERRENLALVAQGK